MELCDLNLATYIHHNSTVPKTIPNLILDDLSDRDAWTNQIWGIMEDLMSGLTFVHEHKSIHRDLKPRNGISSIELNTLIPVLYSSKDVAWKIADFGLASEGTSSRAHTTHSARGTSGYRAPELLREENPNYTNKVDIWATGCILHELVFRKKPFGTDIAVADFERSSRFSGERFCISQEMAISESQKHFASQIILETLEIDHTKRPKASVLYRAFLEQRSQMPHKAVESFRGSPRRSRNYAYGQQPRLSERGIAFYPEH